MRGHAQAFVNDGLEEFRRHGARQGVLLEGAAEFARHRVHERGDGALHELTQVSYVAKLRKGTGSHHAAHDVRMVDRQSKRIRGAHRVADHQQRWEIKGTCHCRGVSGEIPRPVAADRLVRLTVTALAQTYDVPVGRQKRQYGRERTPAVGNAVQQKHGCAAARALIAQSS